MGEKKDAWSSLQVELARQIEDIALKEGWSRGTRIRTATLAQRLGLSRSPIYGALGFLEHEGVVKREPGRGFVLLDPDAIRSRYKNKEMDGNLMVHIMRDRACGHLPRDVSEAGLTERYGVLRGELRKALQRLASEGLVTRSRGHGWHFDETLDTDKAILESYEFRILVECAAFRSPRFQADEAGLTHLIEAHQALLDTVDTDTDTISRQVWFKLNSDFHETLPKWSDNRFIHQSMHQQNALRQLHEYAIFEHLPAGRIKRSLTEHLSVLKAIMDGDLELAEAQLRNHLLTGRKRFWKKVHEEKKK